MSDVHGLRSFGYGELPARVATALGPAGAKGEIHWLETSATVVVEIVTRTGSRGLGRNRDATPARHGGSSTGMGHPFNTSFAPPGRKV